MRRNRIGLNTGSGKIKSSSVSCVQLAVGSKVQGPNTMMKINGSLWLLGLLAVGIRARPESGKIYVKVHFGRSQCLRCEYLDDNGVMYCELTLLKHCAVTAELLTASSSEYRAVPVGSEHKLHAERRSLDNSKESRLSNTEPVVSEQRSEDVAGISSHVFLRSKFLSNVDKAQLKIINKRKSILFYLIY